MKSKSLPLNIGFLLTILIIIFTIYFVFSIMTGRPLWPPTPTEPKPMPSDTYVSPPPSSINNFQECVQAGYPILETYPPQCTIPGGKSFTDVLK